MTDEEKITDLQRHSTINDVRIGNLETKFELFMKSQEDFKAEMRDRDNQRHAEIAEIRQAFQSLQNQNVVVIIGVIAIAVAVFLK